MVRNSSSLRARLRISMESMSSLAKSFVASPQVREVHTFPPCGRASNKLFSVRAIENHPTADGDVPTEPCTIADCGQLDPSDPSLEVNLASDGDSFEDYPADQDPVDGKDVQEYPDVALKIAQTIREVANKLFRQGEIEVALEKYQSPCHFLTPHS